jgi:hypothetical protein
MGKDSVTPDYRKFREICQNFNGCLILSYSFSYSFGGGGGRKEDSELGNLTKAHCAPSS